MPTHSRRTSLFVVLSIVVIAGVVSGSPFAAKPSRYLYVWAGTGDAKTKVSAAWGCAAHFDRNAGSVVSTVDSTTVTLPPC